MKMFGPNRREAIGDVLRLNNEQLFTLNQMWNVAQGGGVWNFRLKAATTI